MTDLAPSGGLIKAVDRYLEAIDSAALSVRRRERARCRSLLRHHDRRGESRLTVDGLRSWADLVPVHRIERRRGRLETARRLIAMTPGYDDLLTWLDRHRNQLLAGSMPARWVTTPAAHPAAARTAARARYWFSEGQPERAEYLARRAIRLDPACAEAHAVIGRIAVNEGRLAVALRQFREALVMCGDGRRRDLRVGVAEVLDGLGETLIRIDCADEAQEVYSRLRHAGPRWAAHSHRILGRIALMEDRPNDALQWLEHVGGIDGFGRALALLLIDRPARARGAYVTALAVNPLVVPLLLGRFDDPAFTMLGGREDGALLVRAERYLEEWTELWDRSPDALVTLDDWWTHPASRRLVMRMANTPEPLEGSALSRAVKALG